MARKKIWEYDSKRLLKEHLKRLAGIDLQILSAQVTQSAHFTELVNQQPWLSTTKLVVKPDMLFGKHGKSGLVALNLDIAQVKEFVKEQLGVEARGKIGDFIKVVFAVFQDLDFSFLEMNPFTMVNGEPYPLDMRGELDDTAAFKTSRSGGNRIPSTIRKSSQPYRKFYP